MSDDEHELWGVRSLRLLLLLALLAYNKRHHSQRARRRRLKLRRATVIVIVASSGISIVDAAHSCDDSLTGMLQRSLHWDRFASWGTWITVYSLCFVLTSHSAGIVRFLRTAELRRDPEDHVGYRAAPAPLLRTGWPPSIRVISAVYGFHSQNGWDTRS